MREENLPFHRVIKYADYKAFETAAVQGQLNQVETVIFDDLTELADIFLFEEKPKHKNLQQAYGKLNDEMLRVIKLWRSFTNFKVVFLCKQERVKDEMTGGMIYGPNIPGKAIPQMLPYLVGNVYNSFLWTNPENPNAAPIPCLRCRRDNQYDAKDRSGKLDPVEPFNLAHIFAKQAS